MKTQIVKNYLQASLACQAPLSDIANQHYAQICRRKIKQKPHRHGQNKYVEELDSTVALYEIFSKCVFVILQYKRIKDAMGLPPHENEQSLGKSMSRGITTLIERCTETHEHAQLALHFTRRSLSDDFFFTRQTNELILKTARRIIKQAAFVYPPESDPISNTIHKKLQEYAQLMSTISAHRPVSRDTVLDPAINTHSLCHAQPHP